MEQLPKIVRERLQAGTKPEVHPDPDLLAAFAENALTERERLQVFEHLSSCADCREVVSLAQPEQAMQHAAAMAAVPAAATARSTSGKPFWSSRLFLGWGAVAACVVLGVALLQYQAREKDRSQLVATQISPDVAIAPVPPAASLEPSPQPAAPRAHDELEARLQPPPIPPKAKFEAGAAKNSARELAPPPAPQLMEKKFGSVGGALSAGRNVLSPPMQIPPNTQQVTVSGANEAVSVTADRPQENLPLQARAPRVAGGVAGKDLSVQPPPALAKESQSVGPPANAAGPATSANSNSLSGFAGRKAVVESNRVAAGQKVALASVSTNYLPAHWAISTDGTTLLRSIGEGGSWTVVSVANNVVLRTVAALGPEVWAGGKGGALYHSTDLGMHWTQVKPSVDGVALTADIVSLDFSDAQHGKVTTSEGGIWTTSDGGKTWQGP